MRPLGFPVTATGPERDAAIWAAHQLREQMCVARTPGMVTHSTINTEKPKVNSASRGTELQTGVLREHTVGSSTFCRMNSSTPYVASFVEGLQSMSFR